MISISVTIWEDEAGQSRFKVLSPTGDDHLEDVTDQYHMASCQDEDGRPGFVVMLKTYCLEPYHERTCDCEAASNKH
jgi:hypothetical protein